MIILAGFKDTKILNALAGTQTPISSSAGLYAIQLHHKSKFISGQGGIWTHGVLVASETLYQLRYMPI